LAYRVDGGNTGVGGDWAALCIRPLPIADGNRLQREVRVDYFICFGRLVPSGRSGRRGEMRRDVRRHQDSDDVRLLFSDKDTGPQHEWWKEKE
jgi:hypothetical protein